MKTLGNRLSGTYLAVAIAGIAVALCLAILLVKVYRGQSELRQSVLTNFRQDLEKHAASLSYFYAERKNDLKNLPAKREISIFFENKALGMSMEYGLRASLIAIEESLDLVLKERMLGQDRIYTRFVFTDTTGKCLIDTEKTYILEPLGKDCRDFLTPERADPVIVVRRLNGQAQLIVSCPYFFKKEYAGQIIAWISTETVQKHLIGPDSRNHEKLLRVYSKEGNFYLPAGTDSLALSPLPDIVALGNPKYHRYRATHPKGGRVELIATWVVIQDTPLFLMGLIPREELFGYLSPRHLLIILGTLSLFCLVGGAIVWWANTRNVILRTRLEEAGNREQEIAEKNRQLEEEIIERKRMEEALRSAEENYRSIFENAVEGIFQSTPEGRCLSANPAMAKIHGYASSEELLAEVTDIERQVYVNPKDREALRRLMEYEGFVKGFEYQVYRKDGAKLWVTESARAVHDGCGNILYYEGFVQDITERKEAEELSRHLIAASPIGIFIIQDGMFQVVNQWFREITSLGDNNLAKVNRAEFVHPDDRQEVEKKAASMLAGKRFTPYEYRVSGKDGKVKWIMETVTPTSYQGKEAVLGFSMDITGHKELEKQLLQAQKMEAVGRLAGGVAHDFNNMLGAIIGYNEMLMKSLNREDPTYHYSLEIRKAADRAAVLTRQLLAFSRKQVLQPRKLNLNTVINDLERMLQRLIGEDIELLLNLDPAVAAVKADPGQMEQVLLNLAINARDATPQGGKLIISTANVNLSGALDRDRGDFTPGTYVILSVSDNGLGMDADTLDHIFEPFFTTKALGSGTGLGLSTVYGVVRQSGGYIEVSSSPGVGTTFKIYLPAVGESLETLTTEETEAEPLRGWETILLVEDEDILRQLIKNSLQMNGYKVLEARNSKEALAICERQRQPIHLLLTDVVMPQMSGRDLAQQLAQSYPELKVVYMSGYAEDVLFRQGVLETGITFLQKPFRQYEMTAKLRALLDTPASTEAGAEIRN